MNKIDEKVDVFYSLLPDDLKSLVFNFLIEQYYDYSDFGELIGQLDLELENELLKFVKLLPPLLAFQEKQGEFTKYKIEVFEMIKNSQLYKHSDIRNKYHFKIVFWFTDFNFYKEDGGELKFYKVKDKDLDNTFFNAENFYEFNHIEEVSSFCPENGGCVYWNNQDKSLLHEVTKLNTNKKRYSITVCVGYENLVNDEC